MAKQNRPQNNMNQRNQNKQQKQQQQMGPGLQSANNYFETAEELTQQGNKQHGAQNQKKNPEKGV